MPRAQDWQHRPLPAARVNRSADSAAPDAQQPADRAPRDPPSYGNSPYSKTQSAPASFGAPGSLRAIGPPREIASCADLPDVIGPLGNRLTPGDRPPGDLPM